MTLFFTSCQKYGWCIALPKCAVVGWSGSQVGFAAMISESGLNAVVIIQ